MDEILDNIQTSPNTNADNFLLSTKSPAPIEFENDIKVKFYSSNRFYETHLNTSNNSSQHNMTMMRYVSLVSARSVKLISSKTTEAEIDSWWTSVREEMRQHAIALSCNSIVGYKEFLETCDDLIIISALGTAVDIVDLNDILSRKKSKNKKLKRK